jgi:hypothetical protein
MMWAGVSKTTHKNCVGASRHHGIIYIYLYW